MSGLGALADLELHHLDLIVASDPGKFLRIERSVPVAATEIPRPDLPDDVAAILAMIRADAALTGVMGEAALFGACIQRTNRVRAERTKTHRRDVEHRGRIWLLAIRPADGDTKLLPGKRLRRNRVMHPLVAFAVDVLLGAERPFVQHHLGALIDHGAGVAAERHAVLLALEEVLPHLRPDFFQQEAHVRRDRIIAQNRVVLLQQVANAENGQAAENKDRYQDQIEHLAILDPDAEQQRRDDDADRQNDVARRKRKQQRFHGIPRVSRCVAL